LAVRSVVSFRCHRPGEGIRGADALYPKILANRDRQHSPTCSTQCEVVELQRSGNDWRIGEIDWGSRSLLSAFRRKVAYAGGLLPW
jgi:hypothetical protein